MAQRLDKLDKFCAGLAISAWRFRSYARFSDKIYREVKRFVEKERKAFGNCFKCYGKGYGTQTLYTASGRNKIKQPTMTFCTCERGEQLETVLIDDGIIENERK